MAQTYTREGTAAFVGARKHVGQALTVAFTNQKGGAAKTTTCSAFADILAEAGARALIIDLDPQPGNISYVLSAEKDDCIGAMELLTEKHYDVKECVQELGRYDMIAANDYLANAEVSLERAIARECRLRNRIAPLLTEYDFILIDTPPSLGTLTLNAITAADEVIIPCDTDFASAAGMVTLIDNVRAIKSAYNPKVKVAGIVITQYRSTPKFDREFAETVNELAEKTGVKVFKSKVRQSVRVKEARGSGIGLIEFLNGKVEGVAVDYESVVEEWANDHKEAE